MDPQVSILGLIQKPGIELQKDTTKHVKIFEEFIAFLPCYVKKYVCNEMLSCPKEITKKTTNKHIKDYVHSSQTTRFYLLCVDDVNYDKKYREKK